MSFDLTFLSASLPLTKTIEKLPGGQLHKSPYPLVTNFTSETVPVEDIAGFYKALAVRAKSAKKPCLLKGIIEKPLQNESRKGATKTNDDTRFLCLDLDGAKFSTPEEVMAALGLQDISYIVQYSSSYRLTKSPLLSCHIFVVLDYPLAAPEIKAWLMHMNLSVPALANGLTLSASNSALHWPLDITACQNDKLLYIAEPVFKGMVSPVPSDERIQLVMKKKHAMPTSRMELKPMESLKKLARDKLNVLRTAAGILPLKVKVKMVGEHEVQTGVGQIAKYEVIDCGEYNRLNLNGGDSQAYWHHKSDPQYLHNFKGEPSLLIKEVLPDYYADLVRNARAVDATPSEDGDLLLAFRDKVTAQYWKGTWNPGTKTLELYPVKSELQLDHFLQGHGRSLGAYVPEWTLTFNPQLNTVVDETNKIINTFVPTEYMQLGKSNKAGKFPVIQKIMDNAIGEGDVQEHFLNWLAVVWQQRRKPLTAWVFHGVEGTGKGLLFHEVLRPLFGDKHAVQKRASELNSQFNGWLEQALIVFVDEIDAEMFVNAKAVEADLRTIITEPMQPIRRMRTDSYSVQNYSALIFSSNKKRPVAIPPGDRRFNIGVFQREKLKINDAEVDSIKDELPAFANYLSTRKAVFSAARTVLQTEAREAIQRMGVTSVDECAQDILSGNLMNLWTAMPDERLLEEAGILDPIATAYAHLLRRFANETTSRLTRDEIALIFRRCVGKIPDGAHKVTAYMRHHGIELKRLRFGNALSYGLDITWVVSREDLGLIREDSKKLSTKLKRVK